MTVEFVEQPDDNNKEKLSEEVVIDNILQKFDSDGEFVTRGEKLRFYRKNSKYFDLMESKYSLIYKRTLNSICLTDDGDKVRKIGGWSKYLEQKKNEEKNREEKANELARIEKDLKESQIKVNNLAIENAEQNKRISDLTEKNLKLENRKLKREIIIGIFSFISAAILTNLKDILIFLKMLFSK